MWPLPPVSPPRSEGRASGADEGSTLLSGSKWTACS